MSLEEYEAFVFAACHTDEEDPAAHWREVARPRGARGRSSGRSGSCAIVGPDTDLRLGVEGRTWLAADGRLNMPDGEVFTSPVETETEGEIRFTFPAIFEGREVEDIRLRFEGGRVVAARGGARREYLQSLLEMDEGARVLGEVAFGLNYEIDRFTRNILFDEKIGGTMHFALGAAFARPAGRTPPGLHWDMICDLRERGRGLRRRRARLEAPGRSSSEPAPRERLVADARVERLASVLVDYSTEVQPGQLVLIESPPARRAARARRSHGGPRGRRSSRRRASRSTASPRLLSARHRRTSSSG